MIVTIPGVAAPSSDNFPKLCPRQMAKNVCTKYQAKYEMEIIFSTGEGKKHLLNDRRRNHQSFMGEVNCIMEIMYLKCNTLLSDHCNVVMQIFSLVCLVPHSGIACLNFETQAYRNSDPIVLTF